MRDRDRHVLHHGPYAAPQIGKDGTLHDEVRGWVRVGGMTDAPIPWPRVKKTGRASLVLCGGLVHAVRVESEIAVAHWWGVGVVTVWSWRKALGVTPINEGTTDLYRRYLPSKIPGWSAEMGRERAAAPHIISRIAAGKRGKPAHPESRAGLLRAAKRRKPKAHRDAIGAANHRRSLHAWSRSVPPAWAALEKAVRDHRSLAPSPSRGRRWHASEDALLGLAPDGVVSGLVARSRDSVAQRRLSLGIPAWGCP